ESFTAPMIYNPWFEAHGIDAAVVPMDVKAEDYAAVLRPLFRLSNIRGALVTMPHKVATVGLLDRVSIAVEIAGSCNAIRRRPDGSLYGDMFDGIGSPAPPSARASTLPAPIAWWSGPAAPPRRQAAARRGCRVLVGTDMLFEQIPAYLDFFGFGRATADDLRALAKISY